MAQHAQSFSPQQKEQFFEEILHLYDLTDDVVNAIGADGVANRKEQLELAIPVIQQAGVSTDIISELYTNIVKNNAPVTEEVRIEFEKAFSNFFYELKRFVDNATSKLMH